MSSIPRFSEFATMVVTETHAAVLAGNATPDFGAVGGSGSLKAIVGALLTYGLVISVLMVIVCAAAWAVSSSSGGWQAAAKAKAGVMVALGGAVLTGGALAWANWLLGVGARL